MESRKVNETKENDGRLCKECRRTLLPWFDEMGALDRHLAMLGALCQAAEERYLDGETIAELGITLRRYRERKAILDFYFLGKELVSLESVNLDEDHPLVRGELTRLSERPRKRRLA